MKKRGLRSALGFRENKKSSEHHFVIDVNDTELLRSEGITQPETSGRRNILGKRGGEDQGYPLALSGIHSSQFF